MYLLEKHKLERVLILDTDAHAGNGTSDYFYSEPRVLFIDIHQDPHTLYPGTGFASQIGEGAGEGRTVNIPLAPGSGDASYRLVFEEIIEPLAKEFQPQIIVRNGGSDPHFNDELTSLGLTTAGFRMIGERVRRIATICGGREIDLIASGYNRDVLPRAWLALLSGVAGWEIPLALERVPAPLQTDSRLPDTRRLVNEIKGLLKPYWKCF
jgi:acetoin utilization protein AcuC